eukprot:CAMPEP_0183461178 /NCGR_PEP_ID=MMETSP0370-20130417/139106_1 /TAXON_ID=268820 /ORGANISM="Peridinium aciculiferum, Strain PAER-2" /LENGTH=78 /DNA_ID=CAMNT_0025653121 /DNA_START=124 /DNA_END=360 /DNA_ORIENTATION=+
MTPSFKRSMQMQHRGSKDSGAARAQAASTSTSSSSEPLSSDDIWAASAWWYSKSAMPRCMLKMRHSKMTKLIADNTDP